jgi:hypothetical protein
MTGEQTTMATQTTSDATWSEQWTKPGAASPGASR